MGRLKVTTYEDGTSKYDAYYKVIGKKKEKHASFNEKKHGKHAKLLAEHFEQTGEVLGNWREIKDDHVHLYKFKEKENHYYEIVVDLNDYDRVKALHWGVYQTSTGYEVMTFMTKKIKVKLHRFVMNATNKATTVSHLNENGLDNRKQNLTANIQPRQTRIPLDDDCLILVYTDKTGNKLSESISMKKYGDSATHIATTLYDLIEETEDNRHIKKNWDIILASVTSRYE